tara:strand:+ start:2961 stop:3986 length:1026 start_codon:yes stop_codon:yes gene_type:complete
MNKINIIVIHTPNLKNRTPYINSTLTYLKNTLEKNGFISNILISNKPEQEDILKDINEYNKRVNYDKENNNIFDNLITSLNVNQISNIEKHRNALKLVKENELNLIIEDDLIISKDYIDNIDNLFKIILTDYNSDILITSDFVSDEDTNLKLINFNNYNKVLITKSSYFINKNTADKLYDFLNILKYDMKTALSKFILDNIDLNVKLLNKCTFLEGSKVGIFLSSTKNKNFLSQNGNYIELIKIINNNTIDDNMYNNALELYKTLEYLDNAEILHLYGILQYKRGNINEAKKYMKEALLKLDKNYGFFSKTNDILNNAINICQFDQSLLIECKNNKSKYSI